MKAMLKTLIIYKKTALLAALAFASPLSHAMIIKMRELHNPHLDPIKEGQTLILMGDYHGAPNPVNNTQNAAIMRVMTEHNSALITEGSTTSSSLSLSQLAQTAAQQNISVTSPDLRSTHAAMAGLMLYNLITHDTFANLMTALKDHNTALDLGYGFAQTCKENSNQLEILERYAEELHQQSDEETIKEGFRQGFDTLLGGIRNELSTIEKAINNHTKYSSLGHSLIDELVIKNDDNTFALNTQSLWHMTERVTNSLFDATLLKSIHEQRDKRLLFVHAGATHTQRLAPILVKAGYQEGTVISHQKEFEIYTQTASDIMNDAKSLSDKSAQYAVDAEIFFTLCKTLPEQTKFGKRSV